VIAPSPCLLRPRPPKHSRASPSHGRSRLHPLPTPNVLLNAGFPPCYLHLFDKEKLNELAAACTDGAGVARRHRAEASRTYEKVLFGDVWERPGLSKRDRSLITVSALIALNRTEQLPFHLERALTNGVTKDELVEAITHLAFYSGWPTSVSAATIAKGVFK
jgi:4-carboxymuconolactone decarboxylase